MNHLDWKCWNKYVNCAFYNCYTITYTYITCESGRKLIYCVCQEEKDLEEEESIVQEGTDYLAPYIAKLTTKLPLSREEAALVRAECLREFQQLMVYRANRLTQQFQAVRNYTVIITHLFRYFLFISIARQEFDDYQKKKTWFSQNKSMLCFDAEQREIDNLARQKYKLQLFNIRLDRQQAIIKKR